MLFELELHKSAVLKLYKDEFTLENIFKVFFSAIIVGLLFTILYQINETPRVEKVIVYKDKVVSLPKHELFIKCLAHRRPLTEVTDVVTNLTRKRDRVEGVPVYGGVDGKDIEDCKNAAIELTE